MVKQSACSLLLLLIAHAVGTGAFATTYSYREVAYPRPGGGTYDTVLHGINNAGFAVGFYANQLNVAQPIESGWTPFIFDGANYTTLTLPFANSLGAEAVSINNSGVVVGNYLLESGGAQYTHGFVKQGNTYTDFSVPFEGAFDTAISDISDDGVIVGFYSKDFSTGVKISSYGFRAIPNGMGGYTYESVDLGDEDPFTLDNSFLNGRNLDDQEVATFRRYDLFADANFVYGVLLPNIQVRYPGAGATTLSDINNEGMIAGRATFANPDKSLYEIGFLVDSADLLTPSTADDEFINLVLPGTGCTYLGGQLGVETSCHQSVQQVNDHGVVVGFFDNDDDKYRGFIGEPVSLLPGDYNRDEVVDAADYTVWRDTFGQTGQGLAADGSGPGGTPNGIVDQFDYALWKSNFGDTASGSAAISTVPEPTNALTLAAGIALVLRTRRQR